MKEFREDIDGVEYASMLYDFYGSLLSDSRSEVMAMYHEDNLSLSEIADLLGTSRQAAHYTLRKAEKALSTYEEKLGLIAAYKRNQKLAADALSVIERSETISAAERETLAGLITRLAE